MKTMLKIGKMIVDTTSVLCVTPDGRVVFENGTVLAISAENAELLIQFYSGESGRLPETTSKHSR
jgi:hypothetical protein